MQAVTDSGSEIASGIKESLEANKKALLDAIAHLDKHLAGINKMIQRAQNGRGSNAGGH